MFLKEIKSICEVFVNQFNRFKWVKNTSNLVHISRKNNSLVPVDIIFYLENICQISHESPSQTGAIIHLFPLPFYMYNVQLFNKYF